MAYIAPIVVASGTTFAQFQAAGASGHLERLITAQGATLAPTVAATAVANGGGGAGGLLAAGTYFFVITETNGFGETTAGPVSLVLTVVGTEIPRVTFQALKAGNTARNIYLTAVGGVNTGPFFLYATGVAAATYDLTTAVLTNSYAGTKPPTSNSTGLTFTNAAGMAMNTPLQLLRSAKDGNLEDAYRFLRRVVEEFNSGQPTTFAGNMSKLRHAHAVFAMLSTLCSEMGTLIDANAGTLGTVVTPIGTPAGHRTWP